MKIFLDSAEYDDIKKLAQTGIIDGVTTNPTSLSRACKDPVPRIRQIGELLPHGIISVEVVEQEPDAVYKQARAIAAIAHNIAVKIPCHRNYYSVIKKLVDEHICLNITLVFSLIQGLMMAKLGVAYISPFVGRLDDNGEDGILLLHQLRQMIDQYAFKTHILAASIRTVDAFESAILAGVDAVTLPVQICEEALTHTLTDKGMIQFLDDWKKIGITHFP